MIVTMKTHANSASSAGNAVFADCGTRAHTARRLGSR